MKFARPLVPGRLVRRYKRFLSDVALDDGATVTAHCPNPGSMMGLLVPEAEVWLSPAEGRGRKLPFTWEMVHADGALVGVNTGRANALAAEAIAAGRIPELDGYRGLRREVPYGERARIDLLLEAPERPRCYVEVKSVTLRRDGGAAGGTAEFPDAVTTRGARHLDELARVAARGERAVMLYVVQRADCARFRVAADIDPAYAAALAQALPAGVEILCYSCNMSPEAIELARPVALDPCWAPEPA